MIKKTNSDQFTELEKLEEICFPYEKWNLSQIKSHHSSQNSLLYFSKIELKPIGYLIYNETDYEVEILRIGVIPYFRRKGIADQLLTVLLTLTKTKEVILEVKSENMAAIALYKKKGFINFAVRKRYYPDGKDAILLKKDYK